MRLAFNWTTLNMSSWPLTGFHSSSTLTAVGLVSCELPFPHSAVITVKSFTQTALISSPSSSQAAEPIVYLPLSKKSSLKLLCTCHSSYPCLMPNGSCLDSFITIFLAFVSGINNFFAIVLSGVSFAFTGFIVLSSLMRCSTDKLPLSSLRVLYFTSSHNWTKDLSTACNYSLLNYNIFMQIYTIIMWVVLQKSPTPLTASLSVVRNINVVK